MSFTSVTGFADPGTLPGFLGLLQTATFRGAPFKVVASQMRVGRRNAVHEYPYRDGGWPEDMGRALRTYSFTGYVIGDLAPAMQLALNTVAEMPGPGLLIHPSVGAQQVACLSCATVLSKDHGRAIAIAFEFLEYSPSGISAYIATAIEVASLVVGALAGANSDATSIAAAPIAAGGEPASTEAAAVTSTFCAQVKAAAQDPGGIVSMAAGLPPPDSDHTYGRYAYGSLTSPLPTGTTVASLQASLATQRQAVATLTTAVVAAAQSLTASTDLMDPLAAVLEAMRAGITDPAQQVRILIALGSFTYEDEAGGAGIEGDVAAVRDAMSAACRRAALCSLALASASYQPSSYNDAVNVRNEVAVALDQEITAAGDAGDDGTYVTFKALRSAVILDLTTRGANLPSVVSVTLPKPMPANVVAQRLYGDATRADQIAAETGVPHPAFCPTVMQVLSR